MNSVSSVCGPISTIFRRIYEPKVFYQVVALLCSLIFIILRRALTSLNVLFYYWPVPMLTSVIVTNHDVYCKLSSAYVQNYA